MQCPKCRYEFQFTDLVNIAITIVIDKSPSDIRDEVGMAGSQFIKEVAKALRKSSLDWKELFRPTEWPPCGCQFEYIESIGIAKTILDSEYSPDIFTGESNDPGTTFIAKLREAFEKLPERWHEEIITGCKSFQKDSQI